MVQNRVIGCFAGEERGNSLYKQKKQAFSKISAKILEKRPSRYLLLHIIIVLRIGCYSLISICAHDSFGANVAVDVVAVTQ